ncbi:MAG TPA: CDP-alcohol phosphatidyltransferase family protein [Bryobacteraceae bacterium]|jgi:cardiolipin synthase|nr:CDP-alcohol phosphatidyltransferase family protein [Bryobacteraceae bacterium]
MPPERVSAVPSGREKTTWRTLPNLLTALRIALIAPFGWLCLRGHDMPALSVFLIAGVTDTVDGTLARRFNQRSKFGRLADPLADKLLTTVAYLVLCLRAGFSALPVWVTIAVIARDVLILIGSLVVYARTRSTAFKPDVIGKANTFIEIGVVVVFLVSSRLVFLERFLTAVYLLLLVSLIVSTIDYLVQGLRMLRTRN